MKKMPALNPWLEIPATDYEGHMEHVGQLQLLNRLFRETLASMEAKALVVLGCTTGNGFEHIDFSRAKRVVAIDINPEYLEQARRRYTTYAGQIQWRCVDLNQDNIGEQEFDSPILYSMCSATRLLLEALQMELPLVDEFA